MYEKNILLTKQGLVLNSEYYSRPVINNVRPCLNFTCISPAERLMPQFINRKIEKIAHCAIKISLNINPASFHFMKTLMSF